MANIDLQHLALDRSEKVSPSVAAPSTSRRQWLTRYLIPGFLLLGFFFLVACAAQQSLAVPRRVTVVPVLISTSAIQQHGDTPLFRAAGWVEPRPFPILVIAQAEGVLEAVNVVEGQDIKAGQVVAHLIRTDAQLLLESAEAERDIRQAAVRSAKAALQASRIRLEQPLHLQVDLAEANAALARVEIEIANLPAQIKAAEARQRFARQDLDYRERAVNVVPAASIRKSRSELEAANAAVEELQSRRERLPKQQKALIAKRDALTRLLEKKTDEHRQVTEAEANVKSAEAKLKQADVTVRAAKLRLERMTIKSPVSGRVLNVVARPGMRLSGLNPGALQDSSTIVTLYQPDKLQVRVDVRLDDVGKVTPGGRVRIESAALTGTTLEGEVLLPTSQADIQKNTLSVKITIRDPQNRLRPEMLCQVTFLAPPQPLQPGQPSSPRLLVPRNLVDLSGKEGLVWLADRLSGTARKCRVQCGNTVGELIEIVSGLTSSDKVIVSGRESLKEGESITISGEDETLGLQVAQ